MKRHCGVWRLTAAFLASQVEATSPPPFFRHRSNLVFHPANLHISQTLRPTRDTLPVRLTYCETKNFQARCPGGSFKWELFDSATGIGR